MSSKYLDKVGGICGVKYWVWWHQIGAPPHFTVFVFDIYDPNTGTFYFRSYKDKNIIMARSHAQLHMPSFVPFLLDHKKIDAYAAELTSSITPPPPPMGA